MASRKPILIFDTSGINQLTAEKDFHALAAGVTAAYLTRLTGSNISELAASTRSDRRGQLLDTCQRLLASGECIEPFDWIVEKHTKAFDQNRKQYGWQGINVRNLGIEQEIIRRRRILDDRLARQERDSATEAQKSFEDIFCSVRPAFDRIFSRGTERPITFAEFVKVLKKPGGAFWTVYGHKFYARNVKDEPDERKIRDFADLCPPFLMIILAATMAQYKRAIVETPKKKKRAGRADLLMSVYLPYCRVFVTHDDDQVKCLREMAAVANLDTEILSYDEFRSRLLAIPVAVSCTGQPG